MIRRLIALRDGRAPRGALAGAAVLLLGALVMTLPLRIVAPLVPGLTAREAEGTVWQGRLREASLGPFVLGTIDARLAVLPLLLGRAELIVEQTHDGKAAGFSAKIARNGVQGARGTLALTGGFGPVPITSMTFADLSARFDGNGCAEAGGEVSATIALPDGSPLSVAGVARCEGRTLLLSLRGSGGMERLDVRIGRDGRWRSDLAVAGLPEEARSRLRLLGFAARPGGTELVLRASGSF